MYFNSLQFVVFFSVVFLSVLVLRGNVRARNLLLLVASYFFYSCWDWRFLGLIWVSTLVDYSCGLAMEGCSSEKRRRLFLLISLTTNLGILGFFKYYDFFAVSASEFFAGLGVEMHPVTLNIILPVGISFYTFQTLSYTIDVYRRRIPSERSLLNFALFVAFFPQLVAGPIERASRLLPQIAKPVAITSTKISYGFYLICSGLFKKVVIADNVAHVSDTIFALEDPTGPQVLIGVYAFAVQIYCDFSGYSDIARGAARCMGFDLMNNFNLPYFATNPSDFWRRWHISLSTWLRDYLYVALGGNRKGGSRTGLNLMATMLLGGLWHGAGWTFVLWGAYHGALLIIHRMFEPGLTRLIRPTGAITKRLWKLVRIIIFFHFTCLGWLFFRAESMAQVKTMLINVVTDWDLGLLALLTPAVSLDIFIVTALILLVAQIIQYKSQDHSILMRSHFALRAAAYTLGVLLFIVIGEYGGGAFIYFQF